MNKRILFVDADPLLMDFYALVRERTTAQWKIARAENSEHALKILAATHFDAVVSDLRMPGTDGTGLMREIRRRHSQTARISVLNLDDQEKSVSKQKVGNQFLANVTPQELFATLLRIGRLDSVLSDENLKSFVNQPDFKPGPRLISLQIIHELNTKNPSLEAIAELALQYPPLAAKLMRAANSAAYARKVKATHPLEAVQYLGLNIIRSIVLSAHIFHDYEHTDLKKFTATDLWNDAWHHTQITQIFIQLEQPDGADTEDPGITELLHHISKLMLAKNSLPPAAGYSYSPVIGPKYRFAEPDRKISRAANASGLVNLFGLWGLTTPLVEAIAFQLQPASHETRGFSPLASDQATPYRVPGFEPNHQLPTDIHANDRLDPKRTDVQKLFPRSA